MIDSIVRASIGTIQYLVKDYFILNAIFNQNMDVNAEFQRTFEHNNVKDMKFLDSQVDGRAILVYNRDPAILSTEQRVARRQVYYDSVDTKKSEFRDFYIGDISINCKIGTNVPEALFIFESLYNIKLYGNKDVEVEISLTDKSPSKIVYNTNFGGITSLVSDNFEQVGQFWTTEFNIKLSGPILSPEVFDYPRILRIKDNYFVADSDKEFSLSNYEYTHQTDIHIDDSGKETGRSGKVYRDIDTIITRFPTQ